MIYKKLCNEQIFTQQTLKNCTTELILKIFTVSHISSGLDKLHNFQIEMEGVIDGKQGIRYKYLKERAWIFDQNAETAFRVRVQKIFIQREGGCY